MDRDKVGWEVFHNDKASQGMVLEWPDEYVVRFAKRWINNNQSVGGRCVLDLFCGAGRHSALLAQFGYGVCAFDISAVGLKLTRELLAKRGLSAQLVRGNALELPFRDESFEAVIAWWSLHTVTLVEMPQVVQEMKRVVRNDGAIVFSTRSDRNVYDESKRVAVERPTELTLRQLEEVCSPLRIETIELNEFSSQNRRCRDSYWIVSAFC